MGKSYKKTPMAFYEKSDSKYNNRKFRHKDFENLEYTPFPSEYKKDTFNTDWKALWTKEQAIAHYNNVIEDNRAFMAVSKEKFLKKYPTLQDYLNYWERCVKRK